MLTCVNSCVFANTHTCSLYASTSPSSLLSSTCLTSKFGVSEVIYIHIFRPVKLRLILFRNCSHHLANKEHCVMVCGHVVVHLQRNRQRQMVGTTFSVQPLDLSEGALRCILHYTGDELFYIFFTQWRRYLMIFHWTFIINSSEVHFWLAWSCVVNPLFSLKTLQVDYSEWAEQKQPIRANLFCIATEALQREKLCISGLLTVLLSLRSGLIL